MSLDALIAELERNLNPGTPLVQAVSQLQDRGFTCRDVTQSSQWTSIKPSRTTGCTLVVHGAPYAWQLDVVLPEDANGDLIRLVINKHRIGL